MSAYWHPNFGPSYTPMEMLDLGIFEGVYTHAIEGIPSKYKSHRNVLGENGPDVNINRFGVKSRRSLKDWRKAGWCTETSPLGWWEWYLKYFEGRRGKEDEVQIARWNSFVARAMNNLSSKCPLDQLDKGKDVRQGLLQWAWDSEAPYSDDVVQYNAKRMARLSSASNLNTESFGAVPDLINLGLTAANVAGEVKSVSKKRKKKRRQKPITLAPSMNPKAYLPYVSVHEDEEHGEVEFTGFSMKSFTSAVQGILNTSRFKNMFKSMNSRGFTVESFFIVEILRTIELLLESKSGRVSQATLVGLRDKIMKETWVGRLKDALPKEFNYNNLKRLNVSLLPKQTEFLEEYAKLTRHYGLDGWLLAAAPGTGKALKHGTKVKLPVGWSLIEDLKVGDVVIGADGKETEVIGVYPQGVVDLFEITFYDGRKAIACKDHLWSVNDGRLGKKPHDERWRTLNTSEIYDYFKNSSRFRCAVPLTKPVELPKKHLRVDPYILGCMLGDGHMTNKTLVINKADEYIKERFSNEFDGEYSLKETFCKGKLNGYRLSRTDKGRRGRLMCDLEALCLLGSKARDKFIPGSYLEGSIEQRWELLRGLMDTDGTVDKVTATPTFCSMSRNLAMGVQKLVRSLGGIAKITEKRVAYKYKEGPETNIAYIVTIRHSEPELLFNLPRKKKLTRKSQYSENLKLSIVDVKPVESDEATCISVDNADKLFLIDDYVVTHNTLTGIAWHLVQEFDTTIYVVPNNSVDDVWEKTLFRFFDKTPTYFISRPNFKLTGKEEFVIVHYEYLPKLIAELHKFKGKRMGLWVDESHNFNELTSQRTNQLIDMALEYVEESVLASGTPLKALGRELVPLFRIIDKLFTKSVEEKFIKTFGSTTGAVLELLRYRMDRSSFKVAKHEVVENVVNDQSLPVKIPNADDYLLRKVKAEIREYITERLRYYDGMKDELVENFFGFMRRYEKEASDLTGYQNYLSAARKMHVNFNQFTDGELIAQCGRFEKEKILPWLAPTERKEFRRAASRYKFPLLVVRGEALGRILTRRRIDCYKDMVPYADLERVVETAKKKTVIFSNYVEVVKEIGEHLDVMGHEAMLVYGDTNKDLKGMLKRFMEDPKAKIIVATYDSLSTAVPLVEASSLVLFDTPFRNYIIEQTIARLDRLDQDSEIDVLRPYLDTDNEDNLSTRSIELAEWSKDLVDSIMDLNSVDGRMLATESYEADYHELATEYYAARLNSYPKTQPPKKLYYVSLSPLNLKTLAPEYPAGTEFALSHHLPDHWKFDAALKRVQLHGTVMGAIRSKYHEWKDLIEKHGTDGIPFYVYECENTDDNEWVAPISLVKARAVHDAHFTEAWWSFKSVNLSPSHSMFRCKADIAKDQVMPRQAYWFHMDDSSPLVLIQAYGDEHVVEHSPTHLRVFEELIEEAHRNLGTESFYETHSDRGGDFGDDRDKLSMIMRQSSCDLYHVSFNKLPSKLQPRLPAGSELSTPDHFSTEPDIPRICYAETIEGAIRAIFPNVQKLAEEHGKEGLEWYLYKVEKGTRGQWVPYFSLATAGFVHDADVTKEWWNLNPSSPKLIGKVVARMDTSGEFLMYKPSTDESKLLEHSPRDIALTVYDLKGKRVRGKVFDNNQGVAS